MTNRGHQFPSSNHPAKVFLFGTALALLSACHGEPPEIEPPQPGTTGGLIVVDSPRVFARERLVRDREEQKKWLERQLARTDLDFDAFQGANQTRSLQRRATRFGFDATTAGALGIRQAEAETDDLSRAQEIADLEHQIKIAELEAQLEALESDELTNIALPTATGSASSPPSESDSSGGTGSDSASGSGSSSDSAGASGSTGGAGFPTLQLPSTEMAAIGVSDRPIDQFRDHLAYREEVRQELLDTGLDDAHDLAGNTLYRFAFDTTVIPGKDSGAWGHVKVTVSETNRICDLGQELDPNEMAFLLQLAADTASALQKSYDLDVDLLSYAYLQEDLTSTIRTDPLIGSMALDERQENNNLRKTYPEPIDRRPAEDAARAKAMIALSTHYLDVIQETGLENIVSAEQPDPGSSSTTFAPRVLATTTIRDEFCQLIKTLNPAIDVYAVTPRESVERLSDSAAARFEQQSVISAALEAGTVGIEGAIEYLNAIENQRQGIRRQPITVGFARRDEMDSEMGWILGPRFTPRYGKSGFDYRHRPTQFPLSAIVSLPGWWTTIRFHVEVCWIADGLGTQDNPTQPCDTKPNKAGSEAKEAGTGTAFDVRLPGDPRELVRVLVPRARRPFPFFYAPGPRLEIDRKEHLVIYGENLWRNPQVFLGAQKADDIDILPDMNGLIATFKKVRAPAGMKKGDRVSSAQAWVWTSEGEASVGEVVLYRPDKPGKKEEPSLAVAVTTPSDRIALDPKNQGPIRLNFQFAKEKNAQGQTEQKVKAIFLKFTGAVVVPPNGTCLVPTGAVWKATQDCSVDLTLGGLTANTGVQLLVYQAKKDAPTGDVIAKKELDWVVVKN